MKLRTSLGGKNEDPSSNSGSAPGSDPRRKTWALRGATRLRRQLLVRKNALKILVTDAHYKHALAIVRSLGRAGHEVTVVATSRKDIAACSRYCSGIEYAPHLSAAGVASQVLEILRRNPHDVLIPVSYLTTVALAREKQQLLPWTRMETAEYEQIRFAADKIHVRELAMQLGIPAPVTLCPESKEDLNECASQLRYPVIAKARRESAGMTVSVIHSREMLLSAYDRLCAGSDFSQNNQPLLQEYIPGYGCGFFALYQHGSCKRVFMHRRIRENPPVGGISCCAQSFYDARLKELSTRLLDALQWHGVAMVEFRYDTCDHEYKLLEINPKFWGSLDLALAAGVDFPGDLCRMAIGARLAYSEQYRRNLRYHWLLSGELQHMMSNPASIPAVLADSFNPFVKSNFWLNDPGPAFSEVCSVLHSGWRKLHKV